MNENKFIRTDLLKIMTADGIESQKARKLTDSLIEAMSTALAAGKVIELRGLGTLEPRERKPRTLRNPHTLAPVSVPARKVIFFRASGSLKKALNGEKDPDSSPARIFPTLIKK